MAPIFAFPFLMLGFWGYVCWGGFLFFICCFFSAFVVPTPGTERARPRGTGDGFMVMDEIKEVSEQAPRR